MECNATVCNGTQYTLIMSQLIISQVMAVINSPNPPSSLEVGENWCCCTVYRKCISGVLS